MRNPETVLFNCLFAVLIITLGVLTSAILILAFKPEEAGRTPHCYEDQVAYWVGEPANQPWHCIAIDDFIRDNR